MSQLSLENSEKNDAKDSNTPTTDSLQPVQHFQRSVAQVNQILYHFFFLI